MTRAFLFPGQGSQAVGMGKALADAFAPARAVFEEVDDALSQRLSKIMWEGPESDLTLTENAQPAIMASSLAMIAVLKDGGFDIARHALLVAGRPIAFATLINAGGFVALTFSDMPPLRQFGVVSASAFVLALLADFTALLGALWILTRASKK